MLLRTLIRLIAFGLYLKLCRAAEVSFSKGSVSIEDYQNGDVHLQLSEPVDQDVTVKFTYYTDGHMKSSQGDYPMVAPLDDVTFPARTTDVAVRIKAIRVGSVVIGVNSTNKNLERLNEVYFSVYVVHHKELVIFAEILGWGFFIGWSLCAYPLLYTVFKTRSFAGVSYGFVALCLISFWAYTIYSCALYFNGSIIAEYQIAHPAGVKPVQLEDVCLTIHLTLLFTFLSIFVPFFDSGGQKVSWSLMIFSVGFIIYGILLFILAGAKAITWLQSMYGLALIKMVTMPMKYMPQVWQNYTRKSTVGFNVLFSWLDFIAGSFTVIQMFVIALNGDDWGSFLGNLPKFVLGAASVVFDVIMLVQHHILYRGNTPYEGISEDKSSSKN